MSRATFTIEGSLRSRSLRLGYGVLLAALGALLVMVVLGLPFRTAEAEQGVISVSAANAGSFTMTISDATAEFGTNLDPDCTASNSTDSVLGYLGSTGDEGCGYVWRSAGAGVNIEVLSNSTWNGWVDATENGGTSGLTIASGSLRWVEDTEPTTYAACTSATAFTTSASVWKSSIGGGKKKYDYFYCLMVDWDKTPGTFSSTVTYLASQA